MKSIFSYRGIYFICLLLAVLTLGTSYYLENYLGIMPCALCILQRFVMIILAVVFLLGFILYLSRRWHHIFDSLAIFFSGLGILLAGRQVWLQTLPPLQNTDCGVSLNYLLQVMPWDQALRKIFQGSAECSLVTWQFLHLSLAQWSLIAFAMFFVISIIQFTRKVTEKTPR